MHGFPQVMPYNMKDNKNVCTLKVLVEDVSSSVILDIALSPENLLTIDADVDLLISGEPIAFGLDFSIDASMLGNVSDITELLETEIERPKVSDLINIQEFKH